MKCSSRTLRLVQIPRRYHAWQKQAAKKSSLLDHRQQAHLILFFQIEVSGIEFLKSDINRLIFGAYISKLARSRGGREGNQVKVPTNERAVLLILTNYR